MLTKKKQRHYLAHHEKDWLRQLEAFGVSRDEEALHRLRVDLKKIRALVRLSSAESGSGAKSHFRGLKKMFRQAGMIRDAASQAHFLEQGHFLSTEQWRRRTAVIEAASGAFAEKIGRFRKTGKSASRRLQADMHGIQSVRVREWFGEEVIRTGILLTETSGLHTARKKIKTLLYVYKLLPPAIAARVRLDVRYLDRLQDAIGEWHDALVASAAGTGEGSSVTVSGIKQEVLANEQVVRDLSEYFYLEVHGN